MLDFYQNKQVENFGIGLKITECLLNTIPEHSTPKIYSIITFDIYHILVIDEKGKRTNITFYTC